MSQPGKKQFKQATLECFGDSTKRKQATQISANKASALKEKLPKDANHSNSNTDFVTPKRPRFWQKKTETLPDGNALSPQDAAQLAECKEIKLKPKLYLDAIHGELYLHPAQVEIMDTRQFKRLKDLKQLGTSSHVFPDGNHSRFEHSVGVSHLAGKLVKRLRKAQPQLPITDVDVLCVQLAGLCHDLGHGPFSHLFDGIFIPQMRPNQSWHHEKASLDMLDYLLQDNHIDLAKYGLTSQDLLFIKETIYGVEPDKRRGRPHCKFFLYDIVNNTSSGLDVDKLDYFMRDTIKTGVSCTVLSFKRIIKLARVAQADNCLQICFPEKALKSIFDVFQTRYNLHDIVYTHKVVKAIELMVADVLVLADPFITVTGRKGRKMRMSETIDDMEAYVKMKDSILDFIEQADDHRLADAQALIERIHRRHLYLCVGATPLNSHDCNRDEFCPAWCGKSGQQLVTDIVRMSAPPRVAKTAPRRQSGAYNRLADDFVGICDFEQDNHTKTEGDEEEEEEEEKELVSHDDKENLGNEACTGPPAPAAAAAAAAVVDLTEKDLIVDIVKIHYGKKDSNPLTKVRFFKKAAEIEAAAKSCVDENGALQATEIEGFQIDPQKYGTFLPQEFQTIKLRLFCRDPAKVELARAAFERWCTSNDCSTPFPSQLSQY